MSAPNNLHVPETPDWFKYLRPDSLLSTADLTKLFSFSPTTISALVSICMFPRPDKVHHTEAVLRKNFWFKSTIEAEIARRQQVRDKHLAVRASLLNKGTT